MAFDFYKAPNAPQPDYGAVVHANLGRAQNRQASINALMQLAEENQKLKAANAQHQAALEQDKAQLAETTRYHNAETTAAQGRLDENVRSREDLNSRAEANTEAANQRQMLTQAANFLRNYHNEQGRMQRAEMEQQQRQQAAEAHRQEQMQKLEQQKKRNDAMFGAMESIDKTRSTFPTQEFSAADVSPIFSTDPSRMAASIKGSRFMAGREDTAADVLAAMQKTKHAIPIAPPDWLTNTVKPFATDLTPEDQLALSKYAHGEDNIPYAASAAEARDRAVNYFAKHSEFAPLFAGSTAQSATQPKAAQDPSEKWSSSTGKIEYSANLKQIGDLSLILASPDVKDAEKAEIQKRVDELRGKNSDLEKRFGSPAGGAAKGPSDAEKIDAILKAHPEWTDQQIQDALNGK